MSELSPASVQVVTMWMRSTAQLLLRQALELEGRHGVVGELPLLKRKQGEQMVWLCKEYIKAASGLVADPRTPAEGDEV